MTTATRDDGLRPDLKPEQPDLAAPAVRPGFHEASQRPRFSLQEVCPPAASRTDNWGCETGMLYLVA